ncbi:NACHT domain-containing protein [Streptomyces sulfonofaciens]|uniref:NACHT domain-containing protein n=1 Tax=Streptomyces sulfonofaciens TaxID=68272 RepID=UPI00167BA1E1|nr:NACHT domain-containing protein [Streptomyces sulfonofaciens]
MRRYLMAVAGAGLLLAVASAAVALRGVAVDADLTAFGAAVLAASLTTALATAGLLATRRQAVPRPRPGEPRAGTFALLERLARHVALELREADRRSDGASTLPLTWTYAPSAVEGRDGGRSRPPVGASLWDAYETLSDRRLVVLGDAGSGKTTMARRFVLDGLDRRRAGDPVPVMFALHSWHPSNGSLSRWMADELESEYGLRRSEALALADGPLITPVLDGLDELPPHARSAVAEQLARGLSTSGGYVLTCRTSAFHRLEADQRRGLGPVLTLLPLSAADAAAQLERGHPEQAGSWDAVARAIERRPEGPLAQAFSSPWLVVLAQEAYASDHESRSPAELTDAERFPTADDIRRRILETADPTARSERLPGESGRRWLGLLTQAMGRDSDPYLLWWRMAAHRPRAVAGRLRWPLLVPPLLMWTARSGRLGVAAAVLLGAAALLTGVGRQAPPPRRLSPSAVLASVLPAAPEGPVGRRSVRHLRRVLATLVRLELGAVAPVVVVLTTVMGVSQAFTAPVPEALAISLVWPCAAGLAAVCLLGLGVPDDRPVPGAQVAHLGRDLVTALVRATAVVLLTCTPLAVVLRAGAGPSGHDTGLLLWTAAAVFAAALLDGSAWGRFRVAHLWHWTRGRLPWSLLAFLGEAGRQGLLAPAPGYGRGSYAFRHDLVRAAFGAQSAGRSPAVRAARRARADILDQVLALPEAIAHVAAAPEGTRRARARERVLSMAVNAFEADLPSVAEAAEGSYERFRQAHRRLQDAAAQRWWTRSGLVRTYRFAAWPAAAVAAAAAGLMVFPAGTLVTVATVVAVFCVLVLAWQWGEAAGSVGRSGGGPGTPGARRPAAPVWWSEERSLIRSRGSVAFRIGAFCELYAAAVWGARVATAPRGLGSGALPTIALAAAATWVVTLLGWLNARPYAEQWTALRSDDPADWPELPGGRGRYRDAAVQARRDWLVALARDGVMPLLRRRLGATHDERSLTLPPIDASRLTGSRGADQFVSTAAVQQTALHLRELESASIGVSGPRGGGKSTLMQRFCAPESAGYEDLLVLVPAPTSYDPREFLVHLFAEVCRAITGESAAEGTERPRRAGRLQRALAGLVALTGMLAVLAAVSWQDLSHAGRRLAGEPRLLVLVGGGLLALVGIAWTLALSGGAGRARAGAARQGRAPKRRASGAQAAAVHHLRTLQYQSTVQRTRSTQFTLPGGLGLQFTGGEQVQHTEHLLSYPELVARFRALLDLVALERRPLGGRVIIGIDELDKVGTAEEAERFLNDLKVVFGIQGCHFLVAVSEDALTAFGRRVLDVRTTFDSAFDRVVTVPPLGLGQARELLELRGVRLPEPFLWLCHALSGGLPRDLLRCVMALTTTRTLRGTDDLVPLARALLAEDADTVLSAQTRYAAALSGAQAPRALRWIADASQAPTAADAWEQLVREAPPVLPDDYPTGRAVTQVRAYLALGATLMRTFTEGTPTEIRDRFEVFRSAGGDMADRFATARALLAAEPDAAWSAVARARGGIPGLRALPEP